MSEPENFLSRWSRRKLESGQEEAPQSREQDASQHEASEATPSSTAMRGDERAESAVQSNEPELDLSKLPSLDSITAETDVRVFLQKGVPAELGRAALRRAWAADPAIRDFIEIAENQWDFATGKGLPGFGDLGVDAEELRRMVASVFEDAPEPPAEPQALASSQPEKAANTALSKASNAPVEGPDKQDSAAAEKDDLAPQPVSVEVGTDVVHRSEVNVASQQSNTEVEYELLPTRRPHGRALPQ